MVRAQAPLHRWRVTVAEQLRYILQELFCLSKLQNHSFGLTFSTGLLKADDAVNLLSGREKLTRSGRLYLTIAMADGAIDISGDDAGGCFL